MVTYDEFRAWICKAGFTTLDESSYADEDVEDDLDLVRTYGGADGNAYERPTYLYDVFEHMLTEKADMDDVTIDDFRHFYRRLEHRDPDYLSQEQQDFIDKEQVRSRLDYWAEEGFLE